MPRACAALLVAWLLAATAALAGCDGDGGEPADEPTGEPEPAAQPERAEGRELGEPPAGARWVGPGGETRAGEAPEAPPGRELERTDWELAGVTSDGRWVAIVVDVGARGCHDYAGTTVEEDEAVVRLVAWREAEIDPDALCMEGRHERVAVPLAAPLGERSLDGCGGDCGTPTTGARWLEGVDDGTVLIQARGEDRAVALAPDGTARGRVGGDVGGIRAVGAGVVAHVPDLTSGVEVVEAATGEHRWTHPVIAHNLGAVAAGGETLLIVADGELRAFDAADGRLRWVADLAPEKVAVDADAGVAVAVAADGEPGELAAFTDVVGFDLGDGAERWRERRPGGPRGELATADGVALVSVAGGRYALDVRTGEERWREVPVDTSGLAGSPAAAGEVLVTRDGGSWMWRAARSGEVVAEQAVDPRARPTVPLADGSVITGDDGVLTRRAADGEVVWRRDLRAALGGAAVRGDRLVVATAVGAVGLAVDDGSPRWWHEEG